MLNVSLVLTIGSEQRSCPLKYRSIDEIAALSSQAMVSRYMQDSVL